MTGINRSFRKLPASQQTDTSEAIDRFLGYFSTGQRPHGVGLTRLQRQYWEIRVGLDTRVLFGLQRNRLTFIFVGDHNDIRRWLRSS